MDLCEFVWIPGKQAGCGPDRPVSIDVLIRNSCVLDITDNCRGMYLALMMAVHIFMAAHGDDTILALTYDCSRIVS